MRIRQAGLLTALLLALAPIGRGEAQERAASERDTIAIWLDSLARDPNGLTIPREAVHRGAVTVVAGETTPAGVAAWHGNVDVRGTVNGDAVAIGGNVTLEPGAVVRGDAVAIGGEVRNDGAVVAGESRTLNALSVGLPPGAVESPARVARRSVSLSVGWYLVLAVIGTAVALFARGKLETIADRIRDDFSRSFLYGVGAQVALLPALIAIVVALAITLIGIVLIPFAIVGFILAAAGALALGFLAMSFVAGDAVMRWRGAAAPYGPAPVLQFLLIGLSLFLLLWVLGGALAWAGILGGVLRFIVGVLTWVAVTTGFGATIATRGGTRVSTPPEMATPLLEDDQSWQTPTPVTGVAAARRPTPTHRTREQ